MTDLGSLQTNFRALIKHERIELDAPVFFIPNPVKPTMALAQPEAIDSVFSGIRPFDRYWLVFEGLGTSIMAVLITASKFTYYLARFRNSEANKVRGKVCEIDFTGSSLGISFFNAFYISNAKTKDDQAITILAETCAQLTLIGSREREDIEVEERQRVNKAREAKGKPPLPPFIHLTNRPLRKQLFESMHTGSERMPHNRRGHWRTYRKTGKRIWISDMKIHGGADQPRNYVVT